MGTKIIFIRHEEPQKDSNTNASQWVLTPKGLEESDKLSNRKSLQNVQAIYTSSEIKSVQTIEPLAQKLNLPIIKISDFDEVRRNDKYLTPEEFEIEKFKQLEDLDYPAFGGETANQALKRFEEAIKKIETENPNKNIVVVSHGTILNLYFAKLLDEFENIKERWSNTKFGVYGEVENRKVIRDIVVLNYTYPNIEKFFSKLGLKVYFSSKEKILFEFVDNEEIESAEKEFSSVIQNDEASDSELKKVWELRHSYQKKFYPKLRPLVLALNEFYSNKDTEYKHQIFFDALFLQSLSLGAPDEFYRYFKSDKDYRKKVFQELLDFDKFLENQ